MMVPRFLRTFLRRSAAWALSEVKVELQRCGYSARCSCADCHKHHATTIVRYLDSQGRPLHRIVEVCDEHAEQIKREQHGASVRDLRGS
jgi:hypothetical protein